MTPMLALSDEYLLRVVRVPFAGCRTYTRTACLPAKARPPEEMRGCELYRMLALVGCLFITLAGTASATRRLQCTPSCKSGWTPVPYTNDGCSYSCLSPIKLNCVSRYLSPSLWQKAYQPYLCGGTSGVSCPAISCAYTSSYSIAGPDGCAFAKSVIQATSVSNTAYSFAAAAQSAVASFCTDPTAAGLSAAVTAAANAYATAVANTIAQWSVFVCNCGCGTLSANYAVVAADLQSVATAIAQAYAEALALVETNCFGDLGAFALQTVEALAASTQLAIDNVYKVYVYAAPGSEWWQKCAATGVQTQIQTAVAEAAACTFANVYAAAYNNYYSNQPDAVAFSCGTSISLAQLGLECPCNIGCSL